MLDDFELQNKKVHLRYIELDESAIGNEILFKIYNNDNNYSNGFMTKWAKVKLHNVVLLPKALFDVDIMKLIKNRFRDKWRKILGEKEFKKDNTEIFSGYSIFSSSGMDPKTQHPHKGKTFWPSCRYVFIKSKAFTGEQEAKAITGESCDITMKVIKKHNLLVFVPPSTTHLKGYVSITSLLGITPYINIYNENKRSHNA
tara:strand:- start:67 stop:666 length:600 start_codon:yes stop_codon:yes gene_type:complete